MKFAKELDDNAVPEWKGKYLDYKGGKKKLKAVSKAIRDAGSKSPNAVRKPESQSPFASLRDAPVASLFRRPQAQGAGSNASNAQLRPTRSRSEAPSPVWTVRDTDNTAQTPRAQPMKIGERSPLRGDGTPKMTRYGSIIGSPPKVDGNRDGSLRLSHAPTMELPAAALDPDRPKDGQKRELNDDYDRPVSPGDESRELSRTSTLRPPPTQMQHTGNAYEISKPADRPKPTSAISKRQYSSLFVPKRANSTPDGRFPSRRMLSFAAVPNTNRKTEDIALEAYRELDFRKAEFFAFLDKELAKIEKFYKDKEDESKERLDLLRDQLHIMREKRLEDVVAEQHRHKHLSTVSNMGHNVGETSRSMAQLGTPTFPGSTAQQDYVRRQQQQHAVPYHTAKRKLKTALQELYRGLELLKSYSLLNRTAFRKINKKFNKTISPAQLDGAQPTAGEYGTRAGDYISEKVSSAHFVQSEIVDKQISDVEDLYARYFERGNHKLAVGKLRAKTAKASDFGGPMVSRYFILHSIQDQPRTEGTRCSQSSLTIMHNSLLTNH